MDLKKQSIKNKLQILCSISFFLSYKICYFGLFLVWQNRKLSMSINKKIIIVTAPGSAFLFQHQKGQLLHRLLNEHICFCPYTERRVDRPLRDFRGSEGSSHLSGSSPSAVHQFDELFFYYRLQPEGLWVGRDRTLQLIRGTSDSSWNPAN